MRGDPNLPTMAQALALDTDEPVEIADGDMHGWVRPISFNFMAREWGRQVEREFLKSSGGQLLKALIR
jgi:hypothetical protein